MDIKITNKYIKNKYGNKYSYDNFLKEYEKVSVGSPSEKLYGMKLETQDKAGNKLKNKETLLIGMNVELNQLFIGTVTEQKLGELFTRNYFETEKDFLLYYGTGQEKGLVTHITTTELMPFLKNLGSVYEDNQEYFTKLNQLFSEEAYKKTALNLQERDDLYLAELEGSSEIFGYDLLLVGYDSENNYIGISKNSVGDINTLNRPTIYIIADEFLGDFNIIRRDGKNLGKIFDQ